jgi:hypothetical protein
MKKILVATLLLWLCSQPFQAIGQNAPQNQPLTPEQKVSARRVKALNDALREFQKNNDQDSAALVSSILDSLNQPGGQSPADLAADLERMKNKVRELVRHGAMESAGTMNYAQIFSFYSKEAIPLAPVNPSHKSSNPPGPGGLVLYYSFDAPDDHGVVHDESGTGNDGRVFGAQWVSTGKFGGAYHFAISNFTDRIVVPDSDSLNADKITVAAWIQASGDTGFFERIFDKDFYHGFAMSVNGDWGNKLNRGKLIFETSNGDGMAGRAVDDGRWHHVAASFDGKTVRCYVDGVESSRQAKKAGPIGKCGWDLAIGNSVVEYGWDELMAYDGLIDEVRIYNRALSADEIKTLATADHAGVDLISSPDSAKPDAAERLKKLQSLYDQGLINKDEFQKKKQEILDSF